MIEKEKAAGMLDTSTTASNQQCTASLPSAEKKGNTTRPILGKALAAGITAQAVTFAELHARKPLFQKRMRVLPGVYVIVRLSFPGVLQVLDPATGNLLAQGVPDFVPQQAGDIND